MIRVTLLKGDDIQVFVNGSILDAVIKVVVKKQEEYHKIYEYLSNKEVDSVLQSSKIDIELTTAYCENSILQLNTAFDLAIQGKEKSDTYKNCKIIQEETTLSNTKDLVTVYKIQCNLQEQEA